VRALQAVRLRSAIRRKSSTVMSIFRDALRIQNSSVFPIINLTHMHPAGDFSKLEIQGKLNLVCTVPATG
jgi:hypothetical protein